jgi:hypothetical protein
MDNYRGKQPEPAAESMKSRSATRQMTLTPIAFGTPIACDANGNNQ